MNAVCQTAPDYENAVFILGEYAYADGMWKPVPISRRPDPVR